jgi:hypothetical protein
MRPESAWSQSERQQKEMQELRRLWEESERVLSLLRFKNGKRIEKATDQEVKEWNRMRQVRH